MNFVCFYLTFNDFLIFFQHLCAQVFLFLFRTCFITLAFTSYFIFIILVLCEIQCVVLPNFSSMFQNVPWKFELLMAFFGMLNAACQVVSCFLIPQYKHIPYIFQTLGLTLGQTSENFVMHINNMMFCKWKTLPSLCV